MSEVINGYNVSIVKKETQKGPRWVATLEKDGDKREVERSSEEKAIEAARYYAEKTSA